MKEDGDGFQTSLPVDDDVIRLPSLGCELPLGEIYDKVEFNP